MYVMKMTKPLETAALGGAWLWLLLSVDPPVPAVLLLGPSPVRPVAMQLGESILRMCNGGLTRLREGECGTPTGSSGFPKHLARMGPGCPLLSGAGGGDFPGASCPCAAELAWRGPAIVGGTKYWQDLPGSFDAFLGKVLWHVLVEHGLLVDPWVLAVLQWSLSSLQDLPPVCYWSWLWVI